MLEASVDDFGGAVGGAGVIEVDLDCWVFFGQCLFSCFRLPSLTLGFRCWGVEDGVKVSLRLE